MKKKIILTASILTVVIVIGAIFSMFSFGEKVVTPVPGSSASFGGYTLMRHSYNKTHTYETKSGYQAHDAMIMQLNDGSSLSSSSEGITVAPTYGDNKFYIRFLTAENTTELKNVKVSDYDYLTVDFDIKTNSLGSYKVYTLFRDTSGTACGANVNCVTISDGYIYANGKSISCTEFVHVTLAYSFNDESGYDICNVYFNGEFYCSFVNPSGSTIDNLDYVEALVIGDKVVINGASLTINNVEFNGFINGYEGPIENVFKYPYSKLKNNTDSVLYGK